MYKTKEELEKFIKKEHWENGKPIMRICKEFGLNRRNLNERIKKFNISTMSHREAIIAGHKFRKDNNIPHAFVANPERYKQNFKKSSERMKIHNPLFKRETLLKTIISKSNYMRKNPTFHEAYLFTFFKETLKLAFDFQLPFDQYIIDFLFNSNIALEVDGRGHASRREKDAKRDEFLCSQGLTVIRVQQDSLFDKRKFRIWKLGKLMEVLKNYIPDLDVSRINPAPIMSKYRMVVRQAYTGAIITY